MTQLVIVGELNPYGAGDRWALYDEPPYSAGGRLRRLVMGVDRSTYLGFTRYNLCGGRWSVPVARGRAEQLVMDRMGDPFVLLGRKVATAFMMAALPAYTRHGQFLLLPHPSGLNRVWSDPDSVPKARRLLAELVPAVQWGSADTPR